MRSDVRSHRIVVINKSTFEMASEEEKLVQFCAMNKRLTVSTKKCVMMMMENNFTLKIRCQEKTNPPHLNGVTQPSTCSKNFDNDGIFKLYYESMFGERVD